MSESISAEHPLMPGQTFSQTGYALSSDLAKLCLPAEYRDQNRMLAWVNSICFLVLAIGLVGLKSPKVIVRPLSQAQEVVPVVFTPPQEQPKPEAQAKPDEPEPQETPLETPQVISAVAPDAKVGFAVPVEGAVAIAPTARLSTPPPPAGQVAPTPTKFDPNAMAAGSYPDPEYPGYAQRNRYEGTVIVEFTVDPSGRVASAKVRKTSGYQILDDAALKAVKERWRFPTGEMRYYWKPFVFQMPK